MHAKNRKVALEAFEGLIERKSLGQDVFDTLKEAIIIEKIPPSGRLVESTVAETMGISRTPVREAFHKLEREGYLEKLPKGGFSVVELTKEDIEDTFGIRSVLEAYAARLAAENYREKDLVRLEEKIEEFQKCLGDNNIHALQRINTEFHDILYSLSKSPRLIKMIDALRTQIYRFRQIILQQDSMAIKSNEDHREMLALIKSRKADEVEKLVREHILKGKEAVLARIFHENK